MSQDKEQTLLYIVHIPNNVVASITGTKFTPLSARQVSMHAEIVSNAWYVSMVVLCIEECSIFQHSALPKVMGVGVSIPSAPELAESALAI